MAAEEYTPISPKIIWPAVIFAARRKERVTGRAIILTVSTSTRKGFSQSGAPPGRRPARKDFGEYIALERIKESQSERPRGRVKIR